MALKADIGPYIRDILGNIWVHFVCYLPRAQVAVAQHLGIEAPDIGAGAQVKGPYFEPQTEGI